MQLLKRHFGNDRIIILHLQTTRPAKSPDPNHCDSWLWGNLKNVLFSSQIANLAELKTRITLHINNVTLETLRPVVEHAVCRFELVAENGGQHIEYVLFKSRHN
ncbi:uncharacterized protein CDAR_415361 [Caerostris darwini]|uniref:Uncharacterized protein n=1 Tax=Caerostris darwini TaxID=1538125 RepID=A0AAV4ML19_9ARAC|nr:uncharacterized protein CDAR_415361 [Caerostris darwini]